MKKTIPLTFKNIKTYPLAKRQSKVNETLFATPHKPGDTFGRFMESLPEILAGADIKALVKAIAKARKADRPVALGMGAHPIKVGLSPVLIDLMERGIVTSIATNGAAIIHDFELAYAGHTSEDVAHALNDGSFGMARETGKILNEAINKGVAKGQGIGRSVGELIEKGKFDHKGLSIFAAGYRLGIPMTVHVAIGSDIIHMHPNADGAAIGQGSHSDFKLFSSVVSTLEGGVYINLGSAVLMPEVFLKALSVARNLGNTVQNITTVNMDFIQQYRTRENVLRRPTLTGGASYALTGHHEIMLPLLAAGVIEEIDRDGR